jgi:hypothetical protein
MSAWRTDNHLSRTLPGASSRTLLWAFRQEKGKALRTARHLTPFASPQEFASELKWRGVAMRSLAISGRGEVAVPPYLAFCRGPAKAIVAHQA